jgi:ATP synthase protein I
MREAVRRVVFLQLCITLAIAPIAALVGGVAAAWSSLVGGALGVIPTLVYWLASRFATSARPSRIVAAHVAAEFLKIVATLGLFICAIVFLKDIRIAPFLATFFLTFIAYWITLYSLGKADERRTDKI